MSGVMDMGTMLENSKELDHLRKQQEDVFLEINKIHKKIQSTPEVVEKSGDSVLLRLRALYVQAKELSETEFNHDACIAGRVALGSVISDKEARDLVRRGYVKFSERDFLVELPRSRSKATVIRIPREKKKKKNVSNALMGQLDTLLQSGLSAAQRKKMEVSEQKKKRMKGDSDVPRHSPAISIRNQLEHAASLKGEQVAARVTPDDAEKDEWFVVKVIHFDKEAKEFEVLDEEPGDDEESVQRKYKLPMSRIIPFPKRGDPSSAPDFPHGRHVLAVYPSTTALYKATVVNPPRKRKTDDYLLEFDDDEEDGSLPQWTVPFHKVVPLPDGHRQ